MQYSSIILKCCFLSLILAEFLVHLQLSMRTIQSLEVLTLEQILGLSEKTLINLFSDVESNEMRRNYTYTCYLMPKQCQKQFTSFGSEMRAYGDIKKHLYQHLDELEREATCKYWQRLFHKYFFLKSVYKIAHYG